MDNDINDKPLTVAQQKAKLIEKAIELNGDIYLALQALGIPYERFAKWKSNIGFYKKLLKVDIAIAYKIYAALVRHAEKGSVRATEILLEKKGSLIDFHRDPLDIPSEGELWQPQEVDKEFKVAVYRKVLTGTDDL